MINASKQMRNLLNSLNESQEIDGDINATYLDRPIVELMKVVEKQLTEDVGYPFSLTYIGEEKDGFSARFEVEHENQTAGSFELYISWYRDGTMSKPVWYGTFTNAWGEDIDIFSYRVEVDEDSLKNLLYPEMAQEIAVEIEELEQDE